MTCHQSSILFIHHIFLTQDEQNNLHNKKDINIHRLENGDYDIDVVVVF